MRVIGRFAVTVVGLGMAGGVWAAPLRSPWTGKVVVETGVAFACPELMPVTADLTMDGFYRLDDPTHSIIDPVRQAAYVAAAGVVKGDGEAIVREADGYRTTGSRQEAACVVRQTMALVKQRSMTGKMSSNQAYYVQGWVAGAIAIAFLKVQGSGVATAEEERAIGTWLAAIGGQTRAYYEAHAKQGDGGNNHLYWAGLELAAIGVAAQDRENFAWGMRAYAKGVGDIQADGTLPREMERGARALHYHLYALAPLVLLAEFGEANGMNSYAASGGAIRRLEEVSVRGLVDASMFAKRTGVKQEVPEKPSGDEIAWAPPYERRFPDARLKGYIAGAPSLHSFYMGGLPPP